MDERERDVQSADSLTTRLRKEEIGVFVDREMVEKVILLGLCISHLFNGISYQTLTEYENPILI